MLCIDPISRDSTPWLVFNITLLYWTCAHSDMLPICTNAGLFKTAGTYKNSENMFDFVIFIQQVTSVCGKGDSGSSRPFDPMQKRLKENLSTQESTANGLRNGMLS